jgi:hypothetical protein
MVWTIEAKLLPFAGISGHLYIEMFDDNGARVCQINGLAITPSTMKPRSIGRPGGLLNAFVGNFVLPSSENATRDHHPNKGRVLFRGNEEDIAKAIEAAKKEAVYINQLDLPYNLLKLNSNSVFMKMVDTLSTVVDINQQAVEEMRGITKILPGINGKITDQFHDAASKDIPLESIRQPYPGQTPPMLAGPQPH